MANQGRIHIDSDGVRKSCRIIFESLDDIEDLAKEIKRYCETPDDTGFFKDDVSLPSIIDAMSQIQSTLEGNNTMLVRMVNALDMFAWEMEKFTPYGASESFTGGTSSRTFSPNYSTSAHPANAGSSHNEGSNIASSNIHSGVPFFPSQQSESPQSPENHKPDPGKEFVKEIPSNIRKGILQGLGSHIYNAGIKSYVDPLIKPLASALIPAASTALPAVVQNFVCQALPAMALGGGVGLALGGAFAAGAYISYRHAMGNKPTH